MSVNETDVREGRINDQLETELNAISHVTKNLEEGRKRITESVRGLIEYGSKNPWACASGALIAGLLLGMYCGRR